MCVVCPYFLEVLRNKAVVLEEKEGKITEQAQKMTTFIDHGYQTMWSINLYALDIGLLCYSNIESLTSLFCQRRQKSI